MSHCLQGRFRIGPGRLPECLLDSFTHPTRGSDEEILFCTDRAEYFLSRPTSERLYAYSYLHWTYTQLRVILFRRGLAMKTVNALTVRNNLGRVLQELEEKREPILVSKGRRIRAVLITPEDFQRRFVDRLAEERKQDWIRKLDELRAPRLGDASTIDVLRELRGSVT